MLFAGIGVVLDGPLILFFEGRTPHFRARVTFGRSGPLTFLFHASGGPISFSSERNGGKNAAKNPWFLDFLPPLAAVFWFVRNVEMTYFSERCRFYSEMRRCAVLHFGRSAAAGTEADQFHISGGLHFAAFARDAERQAHVCGARADFQTAGLNGVFGYFCRRGQKYPAGGMKKEGDGFPRR